jgi:hypothetical protein
VQIRKKSVRLTRNAAGVPSRSTTENPLSSHGAHQQAAKNREKKHRSDDSVVAFSILSSKLASSRLQDTEGMLG